MVALCAILSYSFDCASAEISVVPSSTIWSTRKDSMDGKPIRSPPMKRICPLVGPNSTFAGTTPESLCRKPSVQLVNITSFSFEELPAMSPMRWSDSTSQSS